MNTPDHSATEYPPRLPRIPQDATKPRRRGVGRAAEIGESGGSGGGSESGLFQSKKKGNRISAIPLGFLVAGPGFEPGTFGVGCPKVIGGEDLRVMSMA